MPLLQLNFVYMHHTLASFSTVWNFGLTGLLQSKVASFCSVYHNYFSTLCPQKKQTELHYESNFWYCAIMLIHFSFKKSWVCLGWTPCRVVKHTLVFLHFFRTVTLSHFLCITLLPCNFRIYYPKKCNAVIIKSCVKCDICNLESWHTIKCEKSTVGVYSGASKCLHWNIVVDGNASAHTSGLDLGAK